jgi:hypothetical protein
MKVRRLLLIVAAAATFAADASGQAPDAAALGKRIDDRLAVVFKSAGITPAPRADDAEFLRRIYLDLTGRIPRPSDVHQFLADPSPDKRRRAIDRLLDDPRYAIHFANVWRAELLSEAAANPGANLFQPGFEAWLRQRLHAGIRYDALVRELLRVPIAAAGQGSEPVLRDPTRPNPLAFFAVKEARPENLAAAVTRTFLGIRLECAQCHDHPFAKWKQEQFWMQAAFFAGIEREGNSIFAPLVETVGRREIAPGEGRPKLAATFLTGAAPSPADRSPREALAKWVTSRDNPFFARAAVNRVWGQLFGVGLVEPVDDFRDDNPASDADLLDDLAREFVDSGFDLRHLIRGICQSQAYQRSSDSTHSSQSDTRLPARMGVKALTGEQFFDSLALATGYREDQDKGRSRRQFLTRFALTGSIGEPETSVQQALTLRNGAFVAWATDPQRCPTLIAATQTPGMSRDDRIELLYLSTLSRPSTRQERERLQRSLAETKNETEFLADVYWMLLNSAEFRLNH